MTEIKKGSRQLERMKIISSVKGPVAYMGVIGRCEFGTLPK